MKLVETIGIAQLRSSIRSRQRYLPVSHLGQVHATVHIMNAPLPQPAPRAPRPPRQVLFLLVSALLGATAGYEVGVRVGYALAPHEGPFLAPGHSLWPAALIGAVLGIAVFVPLLWSLRGPDLPDELPPRALPKTAQDNSGTKPNATDGIAKAPPGTFLLAFVRGAVIGGLVTAVLVLLAVLVMFSPTDKWMIMYVITYTQLGAVIGALLGGIVEPLRIRHVRRKRRQREALSKLVGILTGLCCPSPAGASISDQTGRRPDCDSQRCASASATTAGEL
jgi:hypothetical protein